MLHMQREKAYLLSSCTIAHLTAVRMMTNKRDSKNLRGCLEREILNHYCGDCKTGLAMIKKKKSTEGCQKAKNRFTVRSSCTIPEHVLQRPQ